MLVSYSQLYGSLASLITGLVPTSSCLQLELALWFPKVLARQEQSACWNQGRLDTRSTVRTIFLGLF